MFKHISATAVAATLAACSGTSLPGQTETSSLAASLNQPFVAQAVTRMQPSARLAPGVGSATSGQQTTAPRSFSGEPSYKSAESLQKIEMAGAIVNAPQAQRYLQSVLDRLLRHWPYETPRIGVFITSSTAFGGWATADGDILIPVGSLRAFRSEDELAALLAHEAAHILLRHHEREKAINENKKVVNFAVSTAVKVLLVSNTQKNKIAPGQYELSLRDPNRFGGQLLQTAAVCLGTRYFVDKLFDAGWSRQQEDEADLLSADLVHKAGYDLNGNLQVLKHQKDFDGDLEKRLKTRRRADNGEYSAIVAEDMKNSPVTGLFTGFTKAVTQGVVNTFQDLDSMISASHQMTDARQKSLQAYVARHYATRERKAPQQAKYAEVFSAGSMPQYLKQHQAAYEAFEALEGGNIQRAESLALSAIQPPSDTAAATRYVMYLVRMRQGRLDEAFQNLQAIKHPEHASATILHAMALEYFGRNRIEEARRFYRLFTEKAGINAGAGPAGTAADAEAKAAQQQKAIQSFFGFEVNGPCDTINEATGQMVRALGGGR